MRWWLLIVVVVGTLAASPARGVVVYGDLDGQTVAPGDDRGWQYVGSYRGSSAVAIGPNHFIATQHQSDDTPNHNFVLNGVNYATIASTDIAGSDLRVYQVSGTLPVYAELYRDAITTGTVVSAVGMGVRTLGAEVTTAAPPPNEHGWVWGATKGKSWGSNTVEGVITTSGGFELVYFDFDAQAGEAALAVNDSGGGMFIFDDGQWKLAGVHYAVEGRYSTSADGSNPFYAAIYDGEGLFIESGGDWVAAPDRPQRSYASDVSHYASAIDAAVASIPEPGTLALLAAAGSLALLRRR